MILNSLKLRNIRSYTKETVIFPESSVLLAGDIGSGKSTILQAIEFALFGSRRDSISGDSLLRKGAFEGEVELQFSIGDKEVKINRKLRRQRSSIQQDAGYIIIDNRRIDATPTELKAMVLDLIGYPKDLVSRSKSLVYRYTVYTPQEMMKQIILDSDEQRSDTLRKVFGIERYKRIAQNTAIYLRSIKENMRELTGIIQGLSELKDEFKTVSSRLAEEESARSLNLPLIELKRKEKKKIQEDLLGCEKRLNDHKELLKSSEMLDVRLAEIIKIRKSNAEEILRLRESADKLRQDLMKEDEFSDLPSKETLENEISVSEKKVLRLSELASSLKERERGLAERTSRLLDDMSSKNEKVLVLESRSHLYEELIEEVKDKQMIAETVNEVNLRLKDIERRIAENSADMKSSEEMKKNISSLDVCPTCKQEVSKDHKKNIGFAEDKRLAALFASAGELSRRKKEIESLLDKHKRRLDALSENEQKLAAIKVELANLRSVKSEIEQLKLSHAKAEEDKAKIISSLAEIDIDMINDLKRSLEERRSLLKKVHTQELLNKERRHKKSLLDDLSKRIISLNVSQDSLKSDVAGINTEKSTISGRLESFKDVQQEYQDMKELLNRIIEEEHALDVRLAGHLKVIENLKERTEILSNELNKKISAEKDFARYSVMKEWLEKIFLNLMNIIERRVMSRAHSQFAGLFADWFRMLVDDDELSVRIDDSFTPVVSQNGHDTSIEYLSGGEKTSVALAYRLALNKVINDLMSGIKTRDLLILDEPTDGFSGDQLDRIRDVLDQLDLKQTILVSHEQKIESFVDNVLQVSKKDHVSKVESG